MASLAIKKISIQELMNQTGVCFGTSGVRGLVSEMTVELCFAYVKAFLKSAGEKRGSIVAIAMDLRPSSPQIVKACVEAINFAGFRADFCGAIPTPALAYYAQENGFLGIMVTGSHIPFDRNGIKFYGIEGEITKADEVSICRAIVTIPEVITLSIDPKVNHAAEKLYADRYLNFFPYKCLSGVKLGFYEHSSVARDLFRSILERLGAEVISFGRTESFVPIDTEAVSEKDSEMARVWANQVGFNAIISTDGDADRPLIGDESGRWLRGDIACTLSASFLEAHSIVVPVSCNSSIEKLGIFANVVRTRIGSPFVIEGMKKLLANLEVGVVGFEANGGLLIGSTIIKNGKMISALMTRDALLPIICLLVMAKNKKCKVSELIYDLPKRYTSSNRIQAISLKKCRIILDSLAADLSAIEDLLGQLCGLPNRIDQTDGLRIFMDNGDIVHFRLSGNSPELRCYVEADSQERANFLVEKCLSRISLDYELV